MSWRVSLKHQQRNVVLCSHPFDVIFKGWSKSKISTLLYSLYIFFIDIFQWWNQFSIVSYSFITSSQSLWYIWRKRQPSHHISNKRLVVYNWNSLYILSKPNDERGKILWALFYQPTKKKIFSFWGKLFIGKLENCSQFFMVENLWCIVFSSSSAEASTPETYVSWEQKLITVQRKLMVCGVYLKLVLIFEILSCSVLKILKFALGYETNVQLYECHQLIFRNKPKIRTSHVEIYYESNKIFIHTQKRT